MAAPHTAGRSLEMAFTVRILSRLRDGKMGVATINRLCDLCKHRHPGTHPPTCDAFPERIPNDIRLMWADHRAPYPGDGGIRFEPKDDSPATAERLAEITVRVRFPDQDHVQRILKVMSFMSFEGEEQKQRFSRIVSTCDNFDSLPEWCKALIHEAERRSNLENVG